MFSALLLTCLLGAALSADILAVFPHTGKSHFDVFEPLVLELAARGHRLTVISFYPQETPVANYTDISLVGLTPLRLNIVQIGEEDHTQPDTFSVSNIGLPMCEMILVHPPVRQLLKSDARFDLVIIEMFDSDCFLSIVHKFKVPHIGFNSAKTSPAQDSVVGNPSHLGYVSHINLPFNNRMTFLQRVYNVAYFVKIEFMKFFLILWEQREFRRMVGEDIPSLDELAHQVSLILVNTHHSLLRPRPLVPGYVEVGGIHIKPPKLLEKIVWK